MYPHLHRGKDFFTFSKASNNHNNLYGPRGAACNKVQEILNGKDALYGNTANPGAITTALQAFYIMASVLNPSFGIYYDSCLIK